MPFLRRIALARSRCFSGSQRAQVSGVSPTPPCLPNARNPLLLNRFSAAGAGCRCPSGVAPAGLRSPHVGRGSPPRQRPPSSCTHAAWPEGKERASLDMAPASPQPLGSAPPAGVFCGRFARMAAPQLLPCGLGPRVARVRV